MALERRHPTVTWLLLYLAEAHAADEWPIGSRYEIAQHQTLADRAAAATLTQQTLNVTWPVYLDDLTNPFLQTYGAWPTGFYVFHPVLNQQELKGVIEPTGSSFILSQLEAFL